MELVTAGQCTRKQSRLDQTIRNIICGNLEISPVVIRLGVTRLKKTRFLQYLDLFGGREEKEWHDLVCVQRLQMIGLMIVLLTFFSRMVSMVLVLWGVGTILGNGYEIQGRNYVALLQGSEISTEYQSRKPGETSPFCAMNKYKMYIKNQSFFFRYIPES